MTGNDQERALRLLLLDDLKLFRTSLSRFLSTQPAIEVAGDFGSVHEGIECLKGSAVDLTLLDARVGGVSAEEFFPMARQAGYEGRLLIVTTRLETREAAWLIQLGAAGVFLKSDATEQLVQAIRMVAAGSVWLDPTIMREMAERVFVPAPAMDGTLLTERERNVLLGVLDGSTNRTIGRNLGISESTVKGCVQQLFVRAGVRRRSQLVRAAIQSHLPAAGDRRR